MKSRLLNGVTNAITGVFVLIVIWMGVIVIGMTGLAITNTIGILYGR